MLTKLGVELRKLRLDRGELLKDMATKLSIAPAYLSSIENGKRTPTKDIINKVITLYHVDIATQERLEIAYVHTVKEVSLNLSKSSNAQMDLGFAFARKFNSLDKEQIRGIMNILQEGVKK